MILMKDYTRAEEDPRTNSLATERLGYDRVMIFDLMSKVVYCSKEVLEMLKLENLRNFNGKTIDQIYQNSAKESNFPLEMEAMRKKVVNDNVECECLCVAEFESESGLTKIHTKPLYNIDGQVEGTITIFEDLDLSAISKRNELFDQLNKRELSILLLLSLNLPLTHIASLYNLDNVTLTNILRIIFNKLAIKPAKQKPKQNRVRANLQKNCVVELPTSDLEALIVNYLTTVAN